MGCNCGRAKKEFKNLIKQATTPQPTMTKAERIRLRGIRIAARSQRVAARNASILAGQASKNLGNQ